MIKSSHAEKRKCATEQVQGAAEQVGNLVQKQERRRRLAAYYRQLAVIPADTLVPASLCAALWHVKVAIARDILRELGRREAVWLDNSHGFAFKLHRVQSEILRSKATAEQIKQWHADIVTGYLAGMTRAQDWGTLAIDMHSAYFAQHVVRRHAIAGGKGQEAVKGALFSLAWLHQRLLIDQTVFSVAGDLVRLLQCSTALLRQDLVVLRCALTQASVALAKPSKMQLAFSLQSCLVGVSAQQRPLCASLMQQCVEALRRSGGVVLQPTTALTVDTSVQHTLPGHNQGVNCVATYTLRGDDADDADDDDDDDDDDHTDDGDTVYAVTGSWDGTVRLWDISAGELINTLTGHTGSVSCVATFPDDAYAVSGARDNTLRVWYLHTGEHVATLCGHKHWVTDVAPYMQDGVMHVVSASYDATLCMWSLQTMRRVHTLSGHADVVRCVATYTQDGVAFAVSGGDDATLILWRLSTGEFVRTLTGHTDKVWTVATYFRGDSAMAVSGARDDTMRVWNLTTGECTATMRVAARSVYSVAVYPHKANTVYAVASTNMRTIEVWDVTLCQRVCTLRGHAHKVTSVAVHSHAHASSMHMDSDAFNIVSASLDRTLRVYRLPGTDPGPDVSLGHSGFINDVAMYCDAASGQTHAVTASEDGTLCVWNAATGACLHTLTGHTGIVTCVAVFVDDTDAFAVSGSEDQTLRLWHLASGQLVQSMIGHTTSVTDAAVYHLAGIWYAVSADADGRLRQWKVATGQEIWTTRVAASGMAVYQHAGTWYAVAVTSENIAVLLGVVSGRIVRLRTLQDFCGSSSGNLRCLSAAQYLPDAALIASCDGSSLTVWDSRSNGLMTIRVGFYITTFATAAVASTPYAVVARDDPTAAPTLQIFNLLTGDLVYRIKTPARVNSLGFVAEASTSGAWIACGYDDQVQFLHCNLGSRDLLPVGF